MFTRDDLIFYKWKLLRKFKKTDCCVILFGEMRNTLDKLKNIAYNLVVPNNADVFISSWDHDKFLNCDIDKKYLNKIDWFLSPKKIDLFNCLDFFNNENNYDLKHNYKRYVDENTATSFVSKWFHIENAFKYTENYKYVCITRLDVLLNNKINIRNKDICIPCDGDAFFGINDNMVYGPRDLVKIYSETGKNMLRYAGKGQICHPERLLRYHLININNLNIKRTLDKFTIKDSFSYGLVNDIEHMDNINL